jgi:hypothetical protein
MITKEELAEVRCLENKINALKQMSKLGVMVAVGDCFDYLNSDKFLGEMFNKEDKQAIQAYFQNICTNNLLELEERYNKLIV